MPAQDALICPACGARNKTKWEFCVRCGESLQGAQTMAPLAKTQVKGKGKSKVKIEIHERDKGSSLPGGLILGVGAVVLVGLGVAGWRYAASYKPEKADPNLFAIPTQPSAAPQNAQAPPTGPGAADYEEGRRLLGQGRAADALPFLERAAAANSQSAVFQWVFGEALIAAGRTDAGLNQFGAAARLEPGYVAQYARALDRAGRDADARSVYEDVLRSQPDNLPVQEDLARLYYKMGDFAKAAPLLEKAAQVRASDPVLRQELAYAVEKAGDKARAAQLYREVLGLAPSADISRGRLADLLLEQGKGDEALALLKEGIDRDPNVPALRRDLGNALERLGKTQDAIREYREYARLAPNAPDAKDLAERAARLEGAGKS